MEALARKEPARRHRAFVVVERAVGEAWPGLSATIERYAERHADRLELVAPPWIVEGGEAVKNDPAPLSALQTVLHALRLDRQSFVVIVGGGALLDAAGYAAATAHRGIRTVRVPTTVLAQADSGVGVKNGVNAFGVKNFLGTFAPPFAVLNDRRFLESLGRRDTIAGMAEAVKVALIRDPEFLAWLEAHADALAACDARRRGRADSPRRRAPPRAHRHLGGPVRDGKRAAARLRALGGAPARVAHPEPAAPR